jgi:hypothetical protein
MTYDEAKEIGNSLESRASALGKALKAFPREGLMNLPSETVRLSPEYRAAKADYNRAFSELRSFNQQFVKKFAKEIRLERRSGKSSPNKQKDPFIFVEWHENGQYFGANYRESELPTLLNQLRQKQGNGSSIGKVFLNEEIEVTL